VGLGGTGVRGGPSKNGCNWGGQQEEGGWDRGGFKGRKTELSNPFSEASTRGKGRGELKNHGPPRFSRKLLGFPRKKKWCPRLWGAQDKKGPNFSTVGKLLKKQASSLQTPPNGIMIHKTKKNLRTSLTAPVVNLWGVLKG